MPIIKSNTKSKPKAKNKSKPKLRLKQRRFVEEYIKTGNATESAERVYNCKNRTTASAIGTENLGKPLIKAEIDDRLEKAKQKIYHLSQSAEKEEVQLRASQDIIDRREGKAISKVELAGKSGNPIEIKRSM